MIRQKILQQLLEWIECNLDHPISIEDIAQKSGYSRRNIQLLFRNFMHMPWAHTSANEDFVGQPFLSDLLPNQCLILRSLCILIHSSHSVVNLKNCLDVLPENIGTVILGSNKYFTPVINASTSKDRLLISPSS